MSDYLTDFVQESEERITELNNALLTLERDPTDDDAMENIFRVAHTLKGNCGAMGLESASDLAHAIEDLLDAVRQDELEVTPELMDVIFDAVDELETMIDEVSANGEIDTDPTATIEALREHLDDGADLTGIGVPSDGEIESVLERFEPPADDEHNAYLVRLDIADREGVNNGELVVDALIDAFDLIGTEPPRDKIEADAYGSQFDAVFGSAVGETAITSGLEPVEEVDDFELVDVSDQFERVAAAADAADADPGADEPEPQPGETISSEEAQDLDVDELLDEFEEFDDLDEMVEDVGDDELDAFDDMGDAGTFDDLLDEDELDLDDEPTAESAVDASAEPDPGTEPDDSAAPADDEEDVDDANAVFNELKNEVEMVGFDELQDELDELEFDEFDDDDEVGMDELIGDEVDIDDTSFLNDEEPTEAAIDEMLVEPETTAATEGTAPAQDETAPPSAGEDASTELEAETDPESDDDMPVADASPPEADVEPEPVADLEADAESEPEIDSESDIESEPDAELETAFGSEPDSVSEPDAESASDGDLETDTESDPELETDSESAVDSEPDAEFETVVDSEPASAAELDAESELDAELETDAESALDAEPEPDVEFDEDAVDEGSEPESDVATESESPPSEPDAVEPVDASGGESPRSASDAEDGVSESVDPDDGAGKPDDVAASDDSLTEAGDESPASTGADDGAESIDADAADGTAETTAEIDDPDATVETDDETGLEDDFGTALEGDFDSTVSFDDDSDADPFADDGFDDDGFADDLDGDLFADDSFDDDPFADDGFDDEPDFADPDAADGFDSAPTSSPATETTSASFDDAATDETAGDEADEDDVVRRVDEPTLEIPELSIPETTDQPDADQQTDEIQSVRVDVEQIDSLLTLVEGLVTSRVRLRHAVTESEDAMALEAELDDLEDLTTELQETVMDVRLVPLQTVTNRLPRVVRDIARDQDKEVAFEMTGEDVELDRSILDRIGDPLIHLVRNAVDHGIEPPEEREAAEKPRDGSVEVHADRSRDRVTITVEDDGSGLDPDRLRSEAVKAEILTEDEAADLPDEDAYELIFHPGLSTADEVTDVSGRGVGMDVVKRTIEDLEGTVSIDSEAGEGTTVTMTLPVSVAIDDILFVECGGEEFGVPTKTVLDIEPADRARADDDEYSVVRLDDTLETPRPGVNGDGMLVRIRDEVRPVALHCDHVHGQQEVVVKPFEGFMSDIPGLSGATVRGRGEVVNILDVTTL
ncbi:Hpt domain-containing protein [Natronorubrum sp. FCH18a]|uniref:Hpt domain-containing protein n=1 Tax=Natronorubrum sp. FCH18a TaxID=3447018 RepID=UPI003F519605